MLLREQIIEAQKQAMKEKAADKLSVLRMLFSAIKNEEIEQKKELNDEQIQEIVVRQVKQLKDVLVDFEKAGREDLVTKNRQEIKILEEYLPAQLDGEELKILIKKILEENSLSEAKDIGKAMATVMPAVKGKADGTKVREVVNKILNA